MRKELIAGAILAMLVRGPWVNPPWRHSVLGRASLIIGINLLYERFVDAHGWSASDVGQRLTGSAGMEVIVRIVH